MKNTALLVIDVQSAMFSEKKQPHRGDQLLENISFLVGKAREKKIPVLYVQHCRDEGPFTVDSPTWQVHPAVAPREGEPCVRKRFCDSFLMTDLHERLKERGIGQLIVCGMQTEFCVDSTIRNAFSREYKLVIVSDAHTTFSTRILPAEKIIDHHNFIFSGSFGKLATTQEMLKLMEQKD